MPNTNAFRWFKDTFRAPIEAAIAGTPFSVDMLAAIAAQETGHIWGTLHATRSVDDVLALCVGDTLDADKGRKAFPRTKDDLLAAQRGAEMFELAHAALVLLARDFKDYAPAAKKPHKFCHGYGMFQYDIQFFRDDPDYFLQRRWATFAGTLGKCIAELRAAMKRMGIANKTELSDLEKVAVAIAYNAGSFKPAKGLQQGHFDGKKFYGERVFDFLRLAQTVPTAAALAAAPPPAGTAALSPPTPVASDGQILEVDVDQGSLNLRETPTLDPANIKVTLPDGHLVVHVSRPLTAKFVEVETSLNGSHWRGFAASKFLKPSSAAAVPVILPAPAPPSTGIVAAHVPRKAGTVTKRNANANALSLNEPNQPQREGQTPEELRADLAEIIEWLGVEKHARYLKRDGMTFCNIYAHDYCHLAGVYLPRVWWTGDAIERLARGETVEPRLDGTITEQRANSIFHWLRSFGPRFGWRQTGTLTKLQSEVDAGAVGLIIALNKKDGKPGHIAMVVPETDEQHARRDAAGEVIAPLQSQAGGTNFSYGTAGTNWWKGASFADSAFWIHA